MEEQFTSTLKRYLEIQDIQKKLADEKSQLKEILDSYLTQTGKNMLVTQMEDNNVRINKTEKIYIRYNEDVLKERLGSQFSSILSLDFEKIKKNQKQLQEILGENNEIFSSPDRLKIKELIEKGVLDKDTFQGAFHKEIKTILSVSRKPTNKVHHLKEPF